MQTSLVKPKDGRLRHWVLLAMLVFVTAFVLGGCARMGETVNYSGATTLLSPMSQLATVFEATHPGVRVTLKGGGSSAGILDVISGSADLGGVVRELTPEEQRAVDTVPLALDGIAIVANTSAPVLELSMSELRALYTAKTGASRDGRPLMRVGKAAAHGTFQAFAAALNVPQAQMKADAIAGANGEVISMVQSHGNALGYVSFADAQEAIRAGAPIRVVPIDGVMPSPATIGNGSYNLKLSICIVLPRGHEPKPSTLAFLTLLRSETGADAFREAGLVPVGHGQH